MPWKLTDDEKAKLQVEVDDNLAKILEKCIEDEATAKALGITKEQAQEQLKNRPKK
jgi:hypothetical protein